MTGIIIRELSYDRQYSGVAAPCCLGDYYENKKVGEVVRAFIDRYLDIETQLIELSSYSIYDAKELCSALKKAGIDTEILLYCDIDEKPYEMTEEFIGYDVCAEDYYTSPLGLGYLEISSEEVEYLDESGLTSDSPFFEEISDEVRHEYADKLNNDGLFDDKNTADEIEDYCNWLCEQYDDIFEGTKNFRTVKIYLVK